MRQRRVVYGIHAVLESYLARRRRGGDHRPAGPDAATRDKGGSWIFGEVTNDSGQVAVSRMVTPDGYTLTVSAAVAIADRVMRGSFEPGYQTPAGLYGPDMVLELDGVKRFDVS